MKKKAQKKPRQSKKRQHSSGSNDAFMASIGEAPMPFGAESLSLQPSSPLFCEHANEKPLVCECAPTCYCKSRTCRVAEYTPGLTARQMMELRVAAIPFIPRDPTYADAARRDPESNFFYGPPR